MSNKEYYWFFGLTRHMQIFISYTFEKLNSV